MFLRHLGLGLEEERQNLKASTASTLSPKVLPLLQSLVPYR